MLKVKELNLTQSSVLVVNYTVPHQNAMSWRPLPPLFQASWKHRGRSFIQLSVFQSSVHYIAFVNRTRWQLNRRTLHFFYIFLSKNQMLQESFLISATYILLPFPKNVLKDNNVNMIWIRKLLSINKKNDQYYIKAFVDTFIQNNHTCICIHTFEKFNQHFLGIECFQCKSIWCFLQPIIHNLI